MEPVEIGGYRIEEELGRGAMGVVYRAYDPEAEREVALKLLGERAGQQSARLQREAELTARLDHPGIVRIHSAGSHRGRPFVVYELVRGARTLREVLREGAAPTRLARYVADAAHALGAAHAAGVVHRDVKPANILIDDEGRLRIADFGVAISDDLERMTRTGALIGTPRFMAPELFAGKSEEKVGPGADVWSLGIILYEGLSGGRVYRATTLLEMAAEAARGPRPLREVAPQSDPRLQAIVGRALALDPAERYPDGSALAADLERYLGGEEVTKPPPPASSAEGRGRAGRWLALVAVLALLASGAGWLGWRAQERSAAQARAQRLLNEAHSLDRALAERVAELRARLGAEEALPELVVLEGLLAVAGEDEERAEASAELLAASGRPAPPGGREALQAGLALLREAAGPSALEAAEQARAAHATLHLVELTSWEARLRARVDADAERIAAIRLLSQRRAKRPLSEPELEALVGACERLERAPTRASLRAFEGLPQLAPIHSALAVHGLLAQARPEPVRAAKVLRGCADPLPAFLDAAIREQARGWNEQALTLLRATQGGSEGRRGAYRRLSAFLELIRRFDVRDACGPFLERAREAGVTLMPNLPTRPRLADAQTAYLAGLKLQAAQLGFLTGLAQLDPSDVPLVRALLLVRPACSKRDLAIHDEALDALARAGTSSQARAYLRAQRAAARVRDTWGEEADARAREALLLAQPLVDRFDELSARLPTDPGFAEGLERQPRLPALVAATCAAAHLTLKRWKEAERWFDRLEDLEPETWQGLWTWRDGALLARCWLARRLPERSRRAELLRVLGRAAELLRKPDPWTSTTKVARILWSEQDRLDEPTFQLMLRGMSTPLFRSANEVVLALERGWQGVAVAELRHLARALERLKDPQLNMARRLGARLERDPRPAALVLAEELREALRGR